MQAVTRRLHTSPPFHLPLPLRVVCARLPRLTVRNLSNLRAVHRVIEADNESVGGQAAMLRKGDRKYAAEEAIVSRTLNQQAKANPRLAKSLFPSSSPQQPSPSQHGSIKDAFRRKDAPAQSTLFASLTGSTQTKPLTTKSSNVHMTPPPRLQSICASNDDPFKDEVHGKAWNNENFSIAQDLEWLADNMNDNEFDDDDLLCDSPPKLPPAAKPTTATIPTPVPRPAHLDMPDSIVDRKEPNPSVAGLQDLAKPAFAGANHLTGQETFSSQGTVISWSSSPDYQRPLHPSAPLSAVQTNLLADATSKRKLEENSSPIAAPKRRSLPFPSKSRLSERNDPVVEPETARAAATPATNKTRNAFELTASAIKEQRKTHRLQRMNSAVTDATSDISAASEATGTNQQSATEAPEVSSSPKTVEPVFLSQEQRQILDLVTKKGQSVFFTGPAGTGKSVLMRAIIRELKKKWAKDPDRLAVTASTGLAACNIGGITLHSFSGMS